MFITSSTAQGGGGSFKNRKPIGETGCCESGMAERSHWSLSFSDYLPTYLSIFYVSVYLSTYLSLSLFHLIAYLSVSIYLSVCLSIYLSVCLSICLISHLPRCLRTRRFSEPTFRPSGATNHWKNTVFRDFPTFSRICIFFLLTLSLLSASSLLCFSSVHIVGSLTSKLPSINCIC